MPKKQHTEQQIIAALKPYGAGKKTVDVCQKLGVSQATFYLWKRQYAGLGVQELRASCQPELSNWKNPSVRPGCSLI